MRSEHWTQANEREDDTLDRNSTWKIVVKPKDKKIVGCRWIFIIKPEVDGYIDTYKA